MLLTENYKVENFTSREKPWKVIVFCWRWAFAFWFGGS